MTGAPDTYSIEWLHEQLALMAHWRASLSAREKTDTSLVEAITRHEAWLAARLSDLTRHKQAA